MKEQEVLLLKSINEAILELSNDIDIEKPFELGRVLGYKIIIISKAENYEPNRDRVIYFTSKTIEALKEDVRNSLKQLKEENTRWE